MCIEYRAHLASRAIASAPGSIAPLPTPASPVEQSNKYPLASLMYHDLDYSHGFQRYSGTRYKPGLTEYQLFTKYTLLLGSYRLIIQRQFVQFLTRERT